MLWYFQVNSSWAAKGLSHTYTCMHLLKFPSHPDCHITLHACILTEDITAYCCCSVSHVQLFATPRTAENHTSLSITNSQNLLSLMSIESVMPSSLSSSVVPFSSHLQSFPASGSSQVSQFFASGGQSIGVSVSASVLPMNTQDWSPLGWTGWISLQSKGLSRVFSNTIVQKHQFFELSFLYSPTLTSIRDYWKNHSLD